MKKIEIWLYRKFPFAYSDILSFVLHGVLTAIPSLLGLWLGQLTPGAMLSCFIAGIYWNREDGDLQKARAMSDGYKARAKIADSWRDRWTPFAVAFFFSLLALLS